MYIISIALLSISVILVCYVFIHSRILYNKSKTKIYDLVIIPGVPFKDGQWSTTMKNRVLWSIYLYRSGLAKNLIFSGAAVYTPYVEAKIMELYALEFGIDPSSIYTETRAQHSVENVQNCLAIAKEKGYVNVALASGSIQIIFLELFGSKRLKEVGLIPIRRKELRAIMNSYDPDPSIHFEKCLDPNFVSIRKKQSLIQRIKASLGLVNQSE